MKVFISEYCRDVTVRIYGIDGDEKTKEFFAKYFADVGGVYETTDEERDEFNSEAKYTITKAEYFNFLAQHIDNIQKGIDEIAEAVIREEDVGEYAFNDVSYVI